MMYDNDRFRTPEGRIAVFCETTLDYKYAQIFREMPFVVPVNGGLKTLIAGMFRTRVPKYYHIRYLKNGNPIKVWIRYFTIWLVCRITNTAIVWSCHNIQEHTINSSRQNSGLRWFISAISKNIIVLHPAMSDWLPQTIPRESCRCELWIVSRIRSRTERRKPRFPASTPEVSLDLAT